MKNAAELKIELDSLKFYVNKRLTALEESVYELKINVSSKIFNYNKKV